MKKMILLLLTAVLLLSCAAGEKTSSVTAEQFRSMANDPETAAEEILGDWTIESTGGRLAYLGACVLADLDTVETYTFGEDGAGVCTTVNSSGKTETEPFTYSVSDSGRVTITVGGHYAEIKFSGDVMYMYAKAPDVIVVLHRN